MSQPTNNMFVCLSNIALYIYLTDLGCFFTFSEKLFPNPILDPRISVLRPSVCNAKGTPLDSEMGLTVELWSN